MAIRRKLTLVNGTMDTEGDIRTYRTTNSFELHCEPGVFHVPLLPFPDDDDDWDDCDHAE